MEDFPVSIRSSSVPGWAQNCMRAQRFLAITGRRADEDVTEVARHLDFLKKAWISRFQFDPVHLGPPNMDVNFGRILLILVKIDDFPVSLWWMGATLHVRAKIFADHWSTCRQRRHRDRPASGFLEKSVDFPVSVRSGPQGSSKFGGQF